MIEVPKLNKKFDRIILGYFPNTYKFLPIACNIAKKGAIIHFHELAEKPEDIINKIKEMNLPVKVIKSTKVKAYGIRTYHWVIDLRVVL